MSGHVNSSLSGSRAAAPKARGASGPALALAAALLAGCGPSPPGRARARLGRDPVARSVAMAEGRVRMLAGYLESRPERRYGALIALAEMAQPAYAERLVKRFGGEADDTEEARQRVLRLLNDRVLAQVRRWLARGVPEVRSQAALCLGAIAGAGATADLIAALGDRDALVVASAVEALARVGRPALPALIAALGRDDALLMKAAVAQAIARIGDGQAAQVLLLLLRDVPGPGEGPLEGAKMAFLVSVTQTLGELSDPRVLPGLIRCLGSSNARVRECAAHSLARVLESLPAEERRRRRDILAGALAAARQALDDPDDRVRQEAARAAAWAGYRPAAFEEKVAFLIARQDWPGLAALEPPGPVAAALVERLRREHLEPGEAGLARRFHQSAAAVLAELGEPAVAPLAGLLADRDGEPLARCTAALALGELGGPQAERALLSALDDPVAAVRVEATRALGKSAGPRAVEALIALLGDDPGQSYPAAVGALATAGCRALGPLLAALDAPDSQVREAAADALGQVGILAKWRLVSRQGDPPRGARRAAAAFHEADKTHEYRRDRHERWHSRCGMDPLYVRRRPETSISDALARAECLRLAGRRRDVRFLAVLPAIVADRGDQAHVRRTAAMALGDTGAAALGCLPTLDRAAGDASENPRVRTAAAHAARNIRTALDAMTFTERMWLTCLLAAKLDDGLDYPHVRAAVARALLCGGEAAALALPALRRAAALASSEPDLASAAAATLERLAASPASPGRAARAQAAATLAAILESEMACPHPIARTAAEMLGLLGGEAAGALALLERASKVSAGQRQYERRRLRAAAAAAVHRIRRATRSDPSGSAFTRARVTAQEK